MVQPTEKDRFLCFDIQEGYTFRKEIVLMVSPLRKDCTDSVNVHKEVLLADPPTKTAMFYFRMVCAREGRANTVAT
jgi:hypothetical protein